MVRWRNTRRMTQGSKAESLINANQYVHNSDWGEAQADTDRENGCQSRHGWDECGEWFLAVDKEASTETKDHYNFPYGDFNRVRRSGLIAAGCRCRRGGRGYANDRSRGRDRRLWVTTQVRDDRTISSAPSTPSRRRHPRGFSRFHAFTVRADLWQCGTDKPWISCRGPAGNSQDRGNPDDREAVPEPVPRVAFATPGCLLRRRSRSIRLRILQTHALSTQTTRLAASRPLVIA